MMLNKIGILTFHASHNYGSMLQAYALQTYLERLGCKVTIINFRGLAQKAMYSHPGKILSRERLKCLITNPCLFFQDIGKWKKFECFISEHLNISKEHGRLVEAEILVNSTLQLDGIITGGDQIWNMNCIDFSPIYFLPFNTPGVRRIAYSPSLGDETGWNPREYGDVLKCFISNFDFPSVRESSASLFLTSIMGSEIPSVPDPVFLLKKEDYERLAGEKPLVNGKYAFYYSPLNDRKVSGFVSKLAKSKGFKIVSSNKKNTPEEKSFIAHNNTGPIEFINLLINADYVIGCSMHLAAFSIILHKPFLIVATKERRRILDLLKSFGLSSRFIDIGNSTDSFNESPINWEVTDSIIERQRIVGESFLIQSLA